MHYPIQFVLKLETYVVIFCILIINQFSVGGGTRDFNEIWLKLHWKPRNNRPPVSITHQFVLTNTRPRIISIFAHLMTIMFICRVNDNNNMIHRCGSIPFTVHPFAQTIGWPLPKLKLNFHFVGSIARRLINMTMAFCIYQNQSFTFSWYEHPEKKTRESILFSFFLSTPVILILASPIGIKSIELIFNWLWMCELKAGAYQTILDDQFANRCQERQRDYRIEMKSFIRYWVFFFFGVCVLRCATCEVRESTKNIDKVNSNLFFIRYKHKHSYTHAQRDRQLCALQALSCIKQCFFEFYFVF